MNNIIQINDFYLLFHQLTSIKDVENKSTLLHYLVDIVEKNHPDLITFGDELTHCDRAARVSIDVIQKTLRIMDTSLRNLDVDLANNCNKQQCGEDDLFSEVLTVSFINLLLFFIYFFVKCKSVLFQNLTM